MSYSSMREFLDYLEKEGQLVRVKEPVDTHLEMTEIQTRLLAENGPAVLFEKPVMADGSISDMPVVVNLYGTVERVAMGVTMGGKTRRTANELREVGETLAFLRQPEPPRGLRQAFELLALAKTVMQMRPSSVRKAPVHGTTGVSTGVGCWPGRTRLCDKYSGGCSSKETSSLSSQLESRIKSRTSPRTIAPRIKNSRRGCRALRTGS